MTAQKLPVGTAALSYRWNGQPVTSETRLSFGKADGTGDIPIDVVHLDTASEVASQQLTFCEFKRIEDVINGVGARTLDAQVVDQIKYVARRDYRNVVVYEVEMGDKVVPFFEVAFGDDRYDSRTMGAGELAICYLWWSIERLTPSSMVLIEEPECYLSPGSQEALCNFLIQSTVEKRLTLIGTTHSSKIVSSLDDDNLIFVYRRAQGVRVVSGPPPPALLETIGIAPPIDLIILVEDEAGETFCRLLLERLAQSLARRVEIARRNGDGGIVTALREIGGKFRSFAVVGLFDGDMQGRIPPEISAVSVLLPEAQPIEAAFRELVEADPAALANAIGFHDLGPILFALQGSNHHDWYEGLCKQLGMTKQQLFPQLFQLWFRNEDNAKAAKLVVDKLGSFSPSLRHD
jgi:hypothetical protein